MSLVLERMEKRLNPITGRPLNTEDRAKMTSVKFNGVPVIVFTEHIKYKRLFNPLK